MSFNESAGVRAQLQSQVAVRNHIEANVSWLFPEEVQKRCIHVFTYVSKYEDSIVYHAIACANPRYMVVREGQPMTEADTGEKNLRIFFNTNLYPPYATTRGEALESLLEMTEESIASHLELQKYTDLEERRAEAIVKRDWSKMLTNALAPAVERHAEIDDRICSEVRDSLLRELSGHKSVSADIDGPKKPRMPYRERVVLPKTVRQTGASDLERPTATITHPPGFSELQLSKAAEASSSMPPPPLPRALSESSTGTPRPATPYLPRANNITTKTPTTEQQPPTPKTRSGSVSGTSSKPPVQPAQSTAPACSKVPWRAVKTRKQQEQPEMSSDGV